MPQSPKYAAMPASEIKTKPALSFPARFLSFHSVPALLILILIESPKVALLSAFFLAIPFLYIRHSYRLHPDPLYLETLIWTFFGTATIGAVVENIPIMPLDKFLSDTLFGDKAEDFFNEFHRDRVDGLSDEEVQLRAEWATSPKYLVFLLVHCLVITGLAGAITRYVAVKLARRSGTFLTPLDYINTAAVAALGPLTTNSIGWSYRVQNETLPSLLISLVLRLMWSYVGHFTTGWLMGIEMARRDVAKERVGYLQIVGYPALHQGVSFLSFFLRFVLQGQVGMVALELPEGLYFWFVNYFVLVGLRFVGLGHVIYEGKKLEGALVGMVGKSE